MPNWCLNTVTFTAGDQIQQELKSLFLEMAGNYIKEQCGQLPEFVTAKEGYFFDIEWDEYDTLRYETKWCPNITALKEIADHFHTGFSQEYEELGNLIYGEAVYENSTLTDVCLDYEDYDKYHIHEDEMHWEFEGITYESEYEVLEILLERKRETL